MSVNLGGGTQERTERVHASGSSVRLPPRHADNAVPESGAHRWPHSSRNEPTGAGSRDGHWHEAEFRRAYWRRWRLDHPEYREREGRRRALERDRDRERRPHPAPLSEVVLQLAEREIAHRPPHPGVRGHRGGLDGFARRIGVSREALRAPLRGWRPLTADVLDALVLYFGPRRVLKAMESGEGLIH